MNEMNEMNEVNEKPVTISSTGGVSLDGRLAPEASGHAVAICHPHPQFGGSMANNVVLAARDALTALGVTTLRFDFRGVGASGGSWDEGRGESADVAAVIDWLAPHGPAGVHLVAYSFGAAMAAKALEAGLAVASVALISPPVDFMALAEDCLPAIPTLVVAGSEDQYGKPTSVSRWLEAQPAVAEHLSRVTLSGVDHFYWNGEGELKSELTSFFGLLLGE